MAVVGPTATGKTTFALQLAQQALQSPHNYAGVDLISVDSRQVYKGLEILTGADVPGDFRLVSGASEKTNPTFAQILHFPYYQHAQLPIALHGVSIVDLDQDWSVTYFKDFATTIILNAFETNRLPILVGGTGLYHQELFSTDTDLYIPPNPDVRRKAEAFTVEALHEWLFKVSPETMMQMTDSDVQNPRRLVRAIEKAIWNKRYFSPRAKQKTFQIRSELITQPELTKQAKLTTQQKLVAKTEQIFQQNHISRSELISKKVKNSLLSQAQVIMLGMQVSLEIIQKKISERVKERFDQGAILEVKKLEKQCKKSAYPVCSTLGVEEILEYLSGDINQEECQKKWALHEFQYAKRQLTWFKKQTNCIWLDDIQKKQYTLR